MISLRPAGEWENACQDLLQELDTELRQARHELQQAQEPDTQECRQTICAIRLVREAVKEVLRSPLCIDTEEDVLTIMVDFVQGDIADLIIHLFWRDTFLSAEIAGVLTEKNVCCITRTCIESIRKIFEIVDEDEDDDFDDDDFFDD